MGGNLSDKGTYFVPRTDGTDFEVDLSHHPRLALDNAPDIVFTQTGSVMGEDAVAVEQFWTNTKVVSYDDQSSSEEIVGAIFKAIEGPTEADQPEAAEAGFADQGVQVSVRAKWDSTAGRRP